MANCNCGREWTGLAQAHCASGCHEHFSTVANFDRHRPGHDGCRNPADLLDKHGKHVFKPSVNRFGVTWVQNIDRPEEDEGAA